MSKLSQIRKKYSKLIMEVFFYGYWIIALMVKIYYFQFSSGLNLHPIKTQLNAYMLIASLATLLIIFSVCLFIFYKHRKFTLFLVNLILGLIMLADVIYFRYYQTPVNLALIYQVGYVGDVFASIQSLFRIKDLVFIIDLPFYFIFYLLGKKFLSYDHKRVICWSLSLISFLIGIFTFNHVYNVSNTILYNYDRNYAGRDLGILYYHFYDINHFVAEEFSKRTPLKEDDKTTVQQFFEDGVNTTGQAYQGIAAGKNLIIIQVEALQSLAIENQINGEEITPFINDLIEESFYFTNIYHQVAGGNTSDAEFMTNNSLYPAGAGAVYFRYPYNNYLSLPKKLKEEGYNSYAAHAFRPSFWNRQTMYTTLGFDKFINQDDYIMDEKIGWAVSDQSFYRQTLDQIDVTQPFYAFMVSLSSHHPYDAFRNFDNLDVGKYARSQLGDYLKAARYDDFALEEFFKDLKARGLYDNSIVVIYGDHSALYEDQKDDVTEFLGIPYDPFNWQRIQKIPLLIHLPGNEGKRVETIGGQIDTLPTIANLMGLDMPYAMGKDLLNTPKSEGYAVLRDSSLITEELMYLSSTGKVYDRNTGQEKSDQLSQELIKLQDQLMVSDIILGKDYFNKIE